MSNKTPMSEVIYIELKGVLYNAIIETFGTVTLEEFSLIETYIKNGEFFQVDISTTRGEMIELEIMKTERDSEKINVLVRFFGERHNTGIDLIDRTLRQIHGAHLFERLEKLIECSDEKISRQAERLDDEKLSLYFNGFVDFEGYMDYQGIDEEITKLEKLKSSLASNVTL